MKKILLAIAFALIIHSQARADVLVEPYLGYNIGSAVIERNGNSGADTLTGIGIGTRVGTWVSQFFVAADLRYGALSIDGNTFGESSVAAWSAGAVFGGEIAMFRAWAGWNPFNRFTVKDSDLTYKGMGFKLGAGYELAPMVSLNAEYLFNPVSEVCNANDDCVDVASGTSLTGNTFQLSVSAPLSF